MMTAKNKTTVNASTRTESETLELLHAARLNFENLERHMPFVTLQPYYLAAKAQLDDALGVKDMQDSLKPQWVN